jgi:hypothetical protein
MRMLRPGETEVVSGERLIHGNSNAGTAKVTAVDGYYASSNEGGTIYGMTLSEGRIKYNTYEVALQPRMYFAVQTPAELFSDCAVVIELEGYKHLNTIGGPAEDTGRLKYIDGCRDSLIIAPPKIGDPCFNLLHFPKHVRQTMHIHPSVRCGMTIAGRGRAIFPDGEVPLTPGTVWFLETNGKHMFYTDDEELLVTAWHPDSDTGPNDEDHPMLNRTIVNGVSAKYLDEIRTK